MGRNRISREEKVNRRLREEAREGGYEYRPLTSAKVAEAERLNRGLSMLEEDFEDLDLEDFD